MQAEDTHLYSQIDFLTEKEALAYPLWTAKLIRNIEAYVVFFFKQSISAGIILVSKYTVSSYVLCAWHALFYLIPRRAR